MASSGRIHNFFRFLRGREFRVFLVFLCLAVAIWHAEKLRQHYTSVADLGIICTDVPYGYTTPSSDEIKVSVGVEGDGFSLLRMNLFNENKVKVSLVGLRRLSEGGSMWAIYVPKRRFSQGTSLPEHVNVTEVLTDTVLIPLLRISKKLVPVVIRDDVSLMPQCLFSQPTSISPDSVWVTGTNDVVDTISAVFSTRLPNVTLGDTLSRQVALDIPPKISASADVVTVSYFVEPFTEKRLVVPVKMINLPDGYSAKTFPPNVTISFSVGLSQFEMMSPERFNVLADFSTIRPGDDVKRVRLSLVDVPPEVQSVSYTPLFAEFLLQKR